MDTISLHCGCGNHVCFYLDSYFLYHSRHLIQFVIGDSSFVFVLSIALDILEKNSESQNVLTKTSSIL